jgi:hypothetical protein
VADGYRDAATRSLVGYRAGVGVFDDSGHGASGEDFALLQNGHVHLVRHAWARGRLLDDLTALGYAVAVADLGGCASPGDLRATVIAAVPGWPEGYGAGNWDAFVDGLSDHLLDHAHPRRVVVLDGFDAYLERDPHNAHLLLEVMARAGRWHLLFGRRLICLVMTDDPHLDLGTVGAQPVGWNRHEWLLAHRDGTTPPPWIEQS